MSEERCYSRGGGTGKFVVLCKIITEASLLFQSEHVVACAVTNIAVRNINGVTVVG